MPLTVTARELDTACRAVLPFTDRDECVLVTSLIRVEARGGTFTATATDRYVVGHAHGVTIDGVLPATLLDGWVLKQALRTIRHAHGRHTLGDVTVTIGLEETPATDTSPAGTVAALTTDRIRYAVTVVECGWPDLGPLFATPMTGLTGPIGINPRVLAPFLRAQKILGELMRLRFGGETAPVRIEIGDRFVGLLMPCEHPTGSWNDEPAATFRSLAEGVAS